jgi:hypothetical protein
MLKVLILSAVPQAQEEELLGRFRGAGVHDYEWLLQLYAERAGQECLRPLFHTLPVSTPGRQTCDMPLVP